jgi:hypothetical protein
MGKVSFRVSAAMHLAKLKDDLLSQQADAATLVISSAHAVLASGIFQPLSEDTSQASQRRPKRSAGVEHAHHGHKWRAQEWVHSRCALGLALTYHSIHSRGFTKVWIPGCKRGQGCFESESKEDYTQDQATCPQAVNSWQLEGERHHQYVQQHDCGHASARLTHS